MKKAFFIRHAKSSWADPGLRDIDRPLNKRGLRDAPFMAKLLRGKQEDIDLIISSPANRAFTTAIHFAKVFDLEANNIRQEEELYHAYPNEVLRYIHHLDDDSQVILIFGHNPGYTDLANHFSDDYIDNIPTCGIFLVESEVDSWSQFNKDTARLTAFYFPKQYFT